MNSLQGIYGKISIIQDTPAMKLRFNSELALFINSFKPLLISVKNSKPRETVKEFRKGR